MNDAPTQSNQRKQSRIVDSHWPLSIPHPDESIFLSVTIGNTSIRWALHCKGSEGLTAVYNWMTRTRNLPEALKVPVESRLSSCLPPIMHQLLTGSTEKNPICTRSLAVAHLTSCRIPFITVYLISTNSDHERDLERLFEGYHTRLIRLHKDDFVDPLPYETIGIDRLACTRGLRSEGRPVMLVDGGTAMTITFVNKDGSIAGGSITLGLGAKFRALHNDTGALPHIDPTEVIKEWKLRCGDTSPSSEPPLKACATSTRESIIAGVFKEVACFLQGTLCDWKLQQQQMGNLEIPLVMTTGNDGPILADLLQPERCRRLIDMPSSSVYEAEVQYFKHLVHHGIAQVLSQKMMDFDTLISTVDSTSVDIMRLDLLGQRITKEWPNSGKAESESTFHGVITSITPGERVFEDDWFTIHYDDGDTEDLEVDEVYDGLMKYAREGEISESMFSKEKKRQEAKAAALLLAATCDFLETRSQESYLPNTSLGSIEAPSDDDFCDEAYEELETQKHEAVLGRDPVLGRAKRPLDSDPREKFAGVKKLVPATSNRLTVNRRPESTSNLGTSAVAPSMDLDDAVGKRVVKFFNGDPYEGTVTKRDDGFWKVAYDDGDEEDYDDHELSRHVRLYRELKRV